MRRVSLLLALVGAMLFACTGVVLAQQGAPDKGSAKKEDSATAEAKSVKVGPVAGEILVKFKNGASSSQAQTRTHEEKGGEVKETIPKINVDVVEVREGQEEEKVAEYEADPNVEYAEVNGTYRALAEEKAEFTPNDPRYGQQYQYPKIEADDAWDVTRGSSSVKIAILDTGIDQSHEDLASRIGLQDDFTGSASGVEDNYGHGTHVAGSSAAISNNGVGVAGTCQDCGLMNGKVLDDSGSGSDASVANGIIWATDNGAHAINMSLGGGGSQTLENAVDYAWNEGVLVAAAAGNSNTNTKFYPAAYDNAIAVGSTDSGDVKSGFSNYGTWVDVAAPGSSIHSTAPDHNNVIWGSGVKYGTISGTSMATPHVAGLAGLVFSNQGQCSDNACVRQEIESSIVDRSVLNNTGPIDWSKARIDTNKALQGGSGAPTIAGSTPTPELTRVSRSTNVVATFSEEMAKSTLTASNVQLYKDGSSTPISATVTPSGDGLSVTLNPYGTSRTNLAGNTWYQVRVRKDSTGVKDLAGNPLAAGGNYQDGGNYVYWRFKTRFL